MLLHCIQWKLHRCPCSQLLELASIPSGRVSLRQSVIQYTLKTLIVSLWKIFLNVQLSFQLFLLGHFFSNLLKVTGTDVMLLKSVHLVNKRKIVFKCPCPSVSIKFIRFWLQTHSSTANAPNEVFCHVFILINVKPGHFHVSRYISQHVPPKPGSLERGAVVEIASIPVQVVGYYTGRN